MKKLLTLFGLSCFLLQAQTRISEGFWRGVLKLDPKKGVELPFTFNLSYIDDEPIITLFNAEENIVVEDITHKEDSVFIRMPVFDSEFKLRLFPGMMQGTWINHARKDKNVIPFEAYYNHLQRFRGASIVRSHFDGKWEVTFGVGTSDTSKAIGVFNQKMQKVTGTFLTETGDYRYLEGIADGTKLYLSCFDGAHAFLFEGKINGYDEIDGVFYSGAHWKENWHAIKNEDFQLRDPYSITKAVKKTPVSFTYPNLEGKKVSLDDEKYKDKVVIVQLMGSWCPNCMDETAHLTQLYNTYKSKGVEIIALAYEKSDNFDKASRTVSRLKEKYGAQYEFLITGLSGAANASKSLPWLSSVSAFPTTLFLNKKHEIVKIYTGYNGPATGSAYTKMKENTVNLLNELIK